MQYSRARSADHAEARLPVAGWRDLLADADEDEEMIKCALRKVFRRQSWWSQLSR